MIKDQVERLAKIRGVRVFRGYLADDYDGIGQYALVSLSRASQTALLRATVAAGDRATEVISPAGTPVVAISYRGRIEILGLGAGAGAGSGTSDFVVPDSA